MTDDARMLSLRGDGKEFDLTARTASDRVRSWRKNTRYERLQVSKDEVTWIDRYHKPSRSVDVTLNLSCGAQTVPHVMLLQVALFERLGVDFVATAGPQFCCGRTFQRYGLAAGDQLAGTSIKRLASWNAPTNVQCCGSCFIEFDHQVGKLRDETGTAPFEVVHITRFIRDRIVELGDAVPWVRRVPRRVLLVAPETHPSKVDQRGWVIETLNLIPGVEYAGLVEEPSLGSPAATAAPGEPSILSDITPEQYREVQAELESQAGRAGADAIVTHHHMSQREWSKFGSPRLPVVYYGSLIAEALGMDATDRFTDLWQLADADLILERSRPHWESWGIAEGTAREMVKELFVPGYAEAIQHCPCDGDCAIAGLRRDDACQMSPRGERVR